MIAKIVLCGLIVTYFALLFELSGLILLGPFSVEIVWGQTAPLGSNQFETDCVQSDRLVLNPTSLGNLNKHIVTI